MAMMIIPLIIGVVILVILYKVISGGGGGKSKGKFRGPEKDVFGYLDVRKISSSSYWWWTWRICLCD